MEEIVLWGDYIGVVYLIFNFSIFKKNMGDLIHFSKGTCLLENEASLGPKI
jgi:hypothetical protein